MKLLQLVLGDGIYSGEDISQAVVVVDIGIQNVVKKIRVDNANPGLRNSPHIPVISSY